MSLFGGGNKSQNIDNVQPVIGDIQLQTSSYGKPLPWGWGKNRASPNLIWYGAFNPIPVTTTTGGGGGGGKGAPSSPTQSNTTWMYEAAILFGLCEGGASAGIKGIGRLWSNKNVYTDILALRLQLFKGSFSQNPYPYLTSAFPGQDLAYRGITYLATPDFPLNSSAGIDNVSFEVSFAIQYGSIPSLAKTFTADYVTYTLTAAAHGFVNGRCLHLTNSGGALPGGLVAGTDYFAINVTANTFQLSSTMYVSNPSDLASQVIGFTDNGTGTQTAMPYIIDASPSDVANDFLTNSYCGVGFPSAQIGDWSQWLAYCVASGTFVSPVLVDQEAAADFITRMALISYTGIFFSEGKLKAVPYYNQAITGNGATFTPNLTPVYSLTDDEFLSVDSQGNTTDPVTLDRIDPADAYNTWQVNFNDRTNQYNAATSQRQDQSSVELYGVRTASVQNLSEIADPNVASWVVSLMTVRAQNVRNQYTFRLPYQFLLIEPMDLLELTETNTDNGLNGVIVRVISMEEDKEGHFTFVCEDAPSNALSTPQYTLQASAGYRPNFNASAPVTNTPIIVAPPIQLAQSTLELWLAVSGASGWGGCQVWVSSDDATYRQVGTITSPARMGVLSSALPFGADPDTVNTLAVDLSQSNGELISGTQDDADLAHTLCYVDGELISYETSTLTSAGHYSLTYLRRGWYGTTIAAHSAGTKFARIDGAIFNVPYTANQIGTTLYLKLPSFNTTFGGLQSLDEITAIPFVVPAPPPPPDVTNFSVQQNGNAVVFSWSEVSDYALLGYDIGFAPMGTTDWNQFTLLTESAKGTEMTNASVNPGTWTFGIRAKDIANQLSPDITTADLIVVNDNSVISKVEQAVTWLGQGHGITPTVANALTGIATVTGMTVGAVTMSCWMRLYAYLYPTIPVQTNQAYLFVDNSGFVYFSIYNGSGYLQIHSDALPPLGAWVHYLATYDGTAAKLYVNGVLQASTATGSGYLPTPGTSVAAPAAPSTTYDQDSVRIWNRALSAAEALSEFVNVPVTTGLLAAWEYDEGTGVAVIDSSGNGHTLTLSASTAWSASDQTGRMVLHPTGVLVPMSTKLASDYAVISAPSAPTLGTVVGGALGLTTYYVRLTYTSLTGETTYSSESSQVVPALSLLKVTSPASVSGAAGYNVYVATASGTGETLQNVSPIAIGTDWTEPTSGLIVGAALPSVNTTGWEAFDSFVPNPVSQGTYIAPTVDTGFDASLRVFSTEVATMGPGQTGNPVTSLAIDTWLTAGTDLGIFTAWTIGTLSLRYLKAKLLLQSIVNGAVAFVSSFVPTVDTSPKMEHQDSVVVAPGGTAITFPTPYHAIPNVQVTVVSAGPTSASAVSLTSTGCTLHVWTGSTDTGGTVNYTAIGE